jgi:hypothetical protein
MEITSRKFKAQPASKPEPNDLVYSVPMKEKVLLTTEIKWNHFNGWTEYPIYKKLTDIDPTLFEGYNKPDSIYSYSPNHTLSDDMGVMEYKVIGATKKKSDKRVLLICEDIRPDAIFKTIYLQIDKNVVTNCGRVFDTTQNNWEQCSIGDEYKGYRNSKWIKLNHNELSDLFGKVYQDL